MSKPRTIDLTPTWVGVLPMLIAGIEDGSPTAIKIAKEELTRMAQLADSVKTRPTPKDSTDPVTCCPSCGITVFQSSDSTTDACSKHA